MADAIDLALFYSGLRSRHCYAITWNAEVVGAKSKLPVTGGTNRELSGHFENQCRISKIHLIAVT